MHGEGVNKRQGCMERHAEDRDRAMYRIEIQDLEMELYNDEYKDAGDISLKP